MSITDLRKSYELATLEESQASHNPFDQFKTWFDAALNSGIDEPNAMSLSTVNAQGRPSSRIVLIRGFDEAGVGFFTNYDSRKGSELSLHPFACLLFHWVQLEQQIRIEGRVEPMSADESDAYFHSRPVGSRIGAWASDQSRVIASRTELEQRQTQFAERYGDSPPRPPNWGGYRLKPDYFEFWQGRPSRLHDRLRYRLDGTQWLRERLAP